MSVGTHNAMTYGIDSSSELSPDAEPEIRRLHRFIPWVIRRWSKNQSSTVLEQLQMGVRYFDLRIAQKDGKFYYCHGLFAMEVFQPLRVLRKYLDKHPGEMVVLDLQHFYDMTVPQHHQLHAELLQFFDQSLYTSADGSLAQCTLARCTDLKRQVVIICRRCPISLPPQFWPSAAWDTPWPNTASVTKLQSFLTDSLLSRKPQQGFVSQCLITPTGRYIGLRIFFSLQLPAQRVQKKLKGWIFDQLPGPFSNGDSPRPNVFLGDFVNLKNGQFCEWVIQLNYKLALYELTKVKDSQ